MNINFKAVNFIEDILDGSGFEGVERKGLRKVILRKSPEDVIAACVLKGVTVVDATPLETESKVLLIKRAFNKELTEVGVETLTGIVMKCDFDDALVVRESALFRQETSVDTMTLKDVNGVLHKDVAVADILAIVVPIMASRYASVWETKEALIETVNGSTLQEDVDNLVIDFG